MATVFLNHTYSTRQVLIDFMCYARNKNQGPGLGTKDVVITEEIAINGIGALLDEKGELATKEADVRAILIDGYSDSFRIGTSVDLEVITSHGAVFTRDLYLKNPEAATDPEAPKIIEPDLTKLEAAFEGKYLRFKSQVQKLSSAEGV